MDAINLNRLTYFVAVVDAGSFTHAAERLGITKAVVSQQVARLEEELQTTLLMRTTRRVEPTEAGRLLHARSVMILREAEQAFSEVTRSNTEPRGQLRIAAPNDYGAFTLAPLAATLTRRYPACHVELVLSDMRMDLLEHQIDLSVRVGWLDDSSLHARRIGTFNQFLVATPEWAAERSITGPDNLANAPFIANGALKEPLVLNLTRGDFEHRTVRMNATLSANTTPAILAATLASGGLSILPDFLVTEPMQKGQLVRILPDWSLPSGGVHVVYPTSRHRPAKVTAFVGLLIESLRQASNSGRHEP